MHSCAYNKNPLCVIIVVTAFIVVISNIRWKMFAVERQYTLRIKCTAMPNIPKFVLNPHAKDLLIKTHRYSQMFYRLLYRRSALSSLFHVVARRCSQHTHNSVAFFFILYLSEYFYFLHLILFHIFLFFSLFLSISLPLSLNMASKANFVSKIVCLVRCLCRCRCHHRFILYLFFFLCILVLFIFSTQEDYFYHLIFVTFISIATDAYT